MLSFELNEVPVCSHTNEDATWMRGEITRVTDPNAAVEVVRGVEGDAPAILPHDGAVRHDIEISVDVSRVQIARGESVPRVGCGWRQQ